MSLEWITSPVSEEHPAGEDFFENDDPEYSDYYFDAAGRLPEALDFFKPGMEVGGDKQPDVLFDPKTVDLGTELAAIDGLLKRTRDLRLLTLRAQWTILAGNLEDCVQSVEAMAQVLQSFPEDVHPQLTDGPRDRVDAINDLSQQGPMLLPLQYLQFGSTGASLRRIRVAKGERTPHDGEDGLVLDQLIRSMVSEEDETAEIDSQFRRFKQALADIEMACLSNPTPHTPQLKTLTGEIDAVLAVLTEANPALASDEDSDDAAPDTAPGAAASGTTPGPGGTQVYVQPATEVKDHDDAARRLTAVETYFGKNEPSSASVLLVTQARLLIGKSLIDAFDVLMPNSSPRAVVNFSPSTDFKLAHGQLRNLADQVLIDPEFVEPEPDQLLASAAQDQSDAADADDSDQPADPAETSPASSIDSPEPAVYFVNNPADASGQLQVVETYFRSVERSSPIPLLLSRARSYIGKDFETLMKEFIPKEDY